MNPMRLLVLLTVVGTTGSILFAAEPAGTARQGQPAASAENTAAKEAEQKKETEQKKQEAPGAAGDKQPAAATPGEDVDPAPPAKTDADKRPSPQRFVPSEQVRADFDVSFPVDI